MSPASTVRAARSKPRRAVRAAPQQERALQTRGRLLDVAGELLGEVGIERISTNLICARAGVTPPALYRYFKDKYAVLEALGRRLMDRQNEALFVWLQQHSPGGLQSLEDHIEELLKETAQVTASEPGAVWTLRALRAVPQLAHVRIDSHRLVADRMVQVYAPLVPELSKRILWRRARIAIEIGFAIDEMMTEEDRLKPNEVVLETARVLRWILREPDALDLRA